MKHHLIPIVLLCAVLGAVHPAPAAVTIRWTVETSRLQPAVFDVVRGETLNLEAAFQSYGKPLSMAAKPCAIFYQTNGMGSAWWTAPATVRTAAESSGSSTNAVTNVVAAVFSPAMDPGATVINGFLGSTGDIYRAAFTLRFRHGPGATPNELPIPPPSINWANVANVNVDAAPFVVKGSNLASVAYVDTSSATTLASANAYTTDVSNKFDTAIGSLNNATNDLTAKVEAKFDKVGGTISEEGYSGVTINPNSITVNEGGGYYNVSINPFLQYGIDEEYWKAIRVVSDVSSFSQTLPDYLSSLSWHPEEATLSGYGITDAYTKAQTETASTNAAEAVFSIKGPNDIGAYSNTAGQQLAGQVSAIGSHLNAEDAKFVVTNYDSVTRIPEASMQIKLPGGDWRTVWNEMTRWDAFAGTNFNWNSWSGFYPWATNISAQIRQKSEREYAFYDGVTGEVAPDGFFWISMPTIAVCKGMSYQRYVEGESAVWLLESNGMVANLNGTTNGYFRITDEDGNSQFEIIKGDKQTVAATAYSMRSERVMGVTHWFCEYAVTNAASAPVAKFTRSLSSPSWKADTDADCPCNVTWTSGANSYTLEFWPKTTEPSMFCKAEYERGGETRIRQTVPVEMQFIIINGTKYNLTPKTVGGELVIGLTEVN